MVHPPRPRCPFASLPSLPSPFLLPPANHYVPQELLLPAVPLGAPHLTRNTPAPHFTPQHWLLCHIGVVLVRVRVAATSVGSTVHSIFSSLDAPSTFPSSAALSVTPTPATQLLLLVFRLNVSHFPIFKSPFLAAAAVPRSFSRRCRRPKTSAIRRRSSHGRSCSPSSPFAGLGLLPLGIPLVTEPASTFALAPFRLSAFGLRLPHITQSCERHHPAGDVDVQHPGCCDQQVTCGVSKRPFPLFRLPFSFLCAH